MTKERSLNLWFRGNGALRVIGSSAIGHRMAQQRGSHGFVESATTTC